MSESKQFNPRELIRDDATALVRQAVERSGLLSEICRENNTVAGTLRELLAKQILERFLPPYLGTATGAVTNRKGKLGPQVDIAIIDKRVLPTFVGDGQIGLIPQESVIAAIEVKTGLTTKGIEQAKKQAEDLRKLRKGELHLKDWPAPLVSLFCFAGRTTKVLKSEDSGRAYLEDNAEGLNAIVVAKKFSWVYIQDKGWRFKEATEEHEEVKRWLAIMIDSCRTRAEFQWRKLFGDKVTFDEFSRAQHNDLLGAYIRSQKGEISGEKAESQNKISTQDFHCQQPIDTGDYGLENNMSANASSSTVAAPGTEDLLSSQPSGDYGSGNNMPANVGSPTVAAPDPATDKC